jgi:hypothetical protein
MDYNFAGKAAYCAFD